MSDLHGTIKICVYSSSKEICVCKLIETLFYSAAYSDVHIAEFTLYAGQQEIKE